MTHASPDAEKRRALHHSRTKEYEDKVLTSKGKALALEKQLYEELFDLLLPHLEALQQSASALAELDVLVNLAERAYTLNYTCPTFIDKPGIRITKGPPSGG